MENQQSIIENLQYLPFTQLATNLINQKYDKKQKRDIWHDSKWENISKLENDDVGKVGEENN